MRIAKRALPLAAILALASCSDINTPKFISFPATPEGQILKKMYDGTATNEDCSKLVDAREKMDAPEKAALKAGMLGILRQDHSKRVLPIAFYIEDWEQGTASVTPEFRPLVPALVEGLNDPNPDEKEAIPQKPQWAAAGSALLLARMGPVAASSADVSAVGRRFLARLKKKSMANPMKAGRALHLAAFLSGCRKGWHCRIGQRS